MYVWSFFYFVGLHFIIDLSFIWFSCFVYFTVVFLCCFHGVVRPMHSCSFPLPGRLRPAFPFPDHCSLLWFGRHFSLLCLLCVLSYFVLFEGFLFPPLSKFLLACFSLSRGMSLVDLSLYLQCACPCYGFIVFISVFPPHVAFFANLGSCSSSWALFGFNSMLC